MEHTGTRVENIVPSGRVFNSLRLGEILVFSTHAIIGSLLLAGAIFAPTTVMSAPSPQEAGVQVRIYDRDHRDYHNWDDREDHAYRRYLGEQHRTYVEYHRQHYRAQRHYWNWRHSHPDRD